MAKPGAYANGVCESGNVAKLRGSTQLHVQNKET